MLEYLDAVQVYQIGPVAANDGAALQGFLYLGGAAAEQVAHKLVVAPVVDVHVIVLGLDIDYVLLGCGNPEYAGMVVEIDYGSVGRDRGQGIVQLQQSDFLPVILDDGQQQADEVGNEENDSHAEECPYEHLGLTRGRSKVECIGKGDVNA